MEKRFSQVSRQLWAGVLTFLSLFVLILLAYRSSSNHPPNESESALLATLSGLSQLGSALISGWRTGCSKTHADPYFVKSAIARVVSIGIQAQKAELEAQKALENGNAQSQKVALGLLSVMMSMLQEQTTAAIEDWNNLAPNTVRSLVQEGNQAPEKTPLPQEVSNA